MLDFKIETFLTVCRTMNFTRAAEILHITQPAVSQHIHALEAQYGVKLFNYQGRQLRLTESGHLLLQTAATMQHDAVRLKETIRQKSSRRQFCFGATLTIGEYIMPKPIIKWLQDEPDVTLRMLTANTQTLLKLLDQGKLDFAIVEGNFDKQNYDSLVYSKQRYIPVCAPNYTFTKAVDKLEDLLCERLIVREPGSGTRNVLERALKAHNLTVQSFWRVTELGSLNLIKKLVCAGMGIAFFYEPVVQNEIAQGRLCEIALEDCRIVHDFTFLWRKGSVFASAYQMIFDKLKEDEENAREVDNFDNQ